MDQQNLFKELWSENREILKESIAHAFRFALVLGFVLIFDFLIKQSSLDEEKKEIISKIDFYAYVIAFLIFAISYIIKMIYYLFRRRD
jgi:hypothetical protein